MDTQANEIQDNTVYFHSMLGRAWGKVISHNEHEVVMQLWPDQMLSVFERYEIARWTIEGLIVPMTIEVTQ